MPPLREPNSGRVSEPHQPDSRSARRSFKGLRRKQAGFRLPRFGRAALQNVTRSVTISGTTGLQRDGEVSKCLKNWRAGTGLNRRHQDFQCSPWAPADILMGPRLKQSAPLARTPVSRRRAWGRVPPIIRRQFGGSGALERLTEARARAAPGPWSRHCETSVPPTTAGARRGCPRLVHEWWPHRGCERRHDGEPGSFRTSPGPPEAP
jgi:hypothetical protein